MKVTENITITCENNLELLKRLTDKSIDLAIVDPPYGIKENGNRDLKPKGAATERKKYHDALWTQEKPTAEYWKELFRVSKNQIVWGGNYFTDHLPESRCWIVWDKRGTCPGNDFADCEIAWTSFDGSIRKFTWLWNGMLQQKKGHKKQKRIHPTEKPIEAYEFLLNKFAKKGDVILDTHLGSGSHAIACHKLGFELIASEIDEVHYNEAIHRLKYMTDFATPTIKNGIQNESLFA